VRRPSAQSPESFRLSANGLEAFRVAKQQSGSASCSGRTNFQESAWESPSFLWSIAHLAPVKHFSFRAVRAAQSELHGRRTDIKSNSGAKLLGFGREARCLKRQMFPPRNPAKTSLASAFRQGYRIVVTIRDISNPSGVTPPAPMTLSRAKSLWLLKRKGLDARMHEYSEFPGLRK
jgi:hypothetical protein